MPSMSVNSLLEPVQFPVHFTVAAAATGSGFSLALGALNCMVGQKLRISKK